MTDVKAGIDAGRRVVVLSCKREFDLVPITIELPFVMWKDISTGVLAAEVVAEQAVRQRDNGGRRLVLSQGG